MFYGSYNILLKDRVVTLRNESERTHKVEKERWRGVSLLPFVALSPMENGQPPDPAQWAVADVVNYFRMAGFEEQASAFHDQV